VPGGSGSGECDAYPASARGRPGEYMDEATVGKAGAGAGAVAGVLDGKRKDADGGGRGRDA